MTPKEFSNAIEGYNDEKKEQWEMQRLFTAAIVQSNSTKPIDPKKLIKFPWDQGAQSTGKVRVLTGDAVKRIQALRKAKK